MADDEIKQQDDPISEEAARQRQQLQDLELLAEDAAKVKAGFVRSPDPTEGGE